MGEPFDLDGAFMDYDSEQTAGFEVTVEDARRMTANEFIEAYGSEDSPSYEEVSNLLVDAEPSEPTVLDVAVKIRNEGSANGFLQAISWILISPRRSDFYRVDFDLWSAVTPAISAGFGAFTVEPGRTTEIHVPFYRYNDPEYLQSYLEAGVARQVVSPGTYELVITRQPIRNVIEVAFP